MQWHPPTADTASSAVEWANNLPMTAGLGIECTYLSSLEATFVVAETPLIANPNGSVHGGLVAAIADQSVGILAVYGSPPGHLAVTGSLHIQYVRPAFAPLSVSARVLAAGRRACHVELDVDDRDGRRCATAQATMIMVGDRAVVPG